MNSAKSWDPPPSHPMLHSDHPRRLTVDPRQFTNRLCFLACTMVSWIFGCLHLDHWMNQPQTNSPHYFHVCFLAMSLGLMVAGAKGTFCPIFFHYFLKALILIIHVEPYYLTTYICMNVDLIFTLLRNMMDEFIPYCDHQQTGGEIFFLLYRWPHMIDINYSKCWWNSSDQSCLMLKTSLYQSFKSLHSSH